MFLRQLGLLLWKNTIIRKRQSIRTIIEILWPLFLFSILVAIRKTRPIVIQDECHYPARALPSAGVFPWLQTLMCNLQNPCFTVPVDSEYPGQVNAPNQEPKGILGGVANVLNTIRDKTTLLDNPDKLVYQIRVLEAVSNALLSEDSNIKVPISTLLKNPVLVKSNLETVVPSDFVDSLFLSEVNLAQASYLSLVQTPHQQRDLACNVERLKAALTVSSGSYTPMEMVNVLCPLNDTSLNFVFKQISDGIDVQYFLNKQDLTKLLDEVTEEADVNQSDLTFMFLTDWPKMLPQLELVGEAVAELMTSLSAASTNGNMLESVLGYDISSPDGMRDFCGHPQSTNMTFINITDGDSFLGNVTEIISDHVDNITGKLPGERNATAMCAKVIDRFDSNNSTSFAVFWKVMKPVLLGKIPFSPDTKLTRLIIKRANTTFTSIAQWEEFGEKWEATYAQQVYDYMENSPVVNELRAMLASDIDLSLLGINLTQANIESLQAFLSNDKSNPKSWKNTFANVDTAIRLITDILKCVNLDKFMGYQNEDEMVDASLSLIHNNTFWAGIEFESPSVDDVDMPEHVKYKIRQDVDDVMRTDLIERFFWTVGSHSSALNLRYYINGFIDVKDMIDHGLIESVTMEINKTKPIVSSVPLSLPKLGQYVNVFPYPCYTSDEFLEYMGSMMAITMVLSWVYSVCVITQKIVYEKEKRLKEIMKMMGLSNAVHWVAWFITSFTLMVISIILLIALLKLGDITPYSNVFLLFIWLMSFAIATIAECFLISCFFSQANLAAACGGIIYFMLYIPYNFAVAWDNKLTFGGKIGLSLFSSVAFGYGSDIMSKYEMGGVGIQFSNWHQSPIVSDERQYTFVTSIVMMLVDATIYFIMTWYVENAFPGRYGVPRKCYFPFQKSYWTGTPDKHSKTDMSFSNNVADALVESEPTHLRLGVSIKNLVKIYSEGNKLAVSNLSLNFYEDQITSFLGHNGAGKTTTMSILSGLFPATSGTATIYGHNIADDMDSIRQNLGFCPQHNVLFGGLTVAEHLRFFGGLKGLTDKEIETQLNDMLHDINLVDKRDEVSRNLSGGMKRKLSVAIAFVGNSKCIILDEPTAGVDPYARRGIWDMVINYKQGRTILLSTHHMDEADLLGDRIAIISQGHLKTCGSSLFLKSSLGVGYYITIVKDDPESSSQKSSEMTQRRIKQIDEENASIPSSSTDSGNYSNEASCLSSSEEIASIMKKVIPESELHEESTREVTYIIPYEAQQDGRYGQLFELLDSQQYTYGLTDTSLEEIFLSVAKHITENKEIEDSKCFSCCLKPKHNRQNSVRHSFMTATTVPSNRDPIQLLKINAIESALESEVSTYESGTTNTNDLADDSTSGTSDELLNHFQPKGSWQVVGWPLVLQQFTALIMKRFHHSRRNRKGFIAQILLPSIFVAIALGFTLLYPPGVGQPALELQPWLYGSTYSFFSNDDPLNKDASTVSDALVSDPGIGTRCVNNYTVTYDGKPYPCVNIDNVWKYDNATKSLSQPIDSNEEAYCKCGTSENPLLLPVCNDGAGGEPTPIVTTDTTDWMYNMSGRNVADWMVKTTDRFVQERFGGLSIGEKYHTALDYTEVDKILNIVERLNKTTADTRQMFDMFLQNMWRTENAKVWFDNNGFHSMPIWQNVLNNAILRSNLPPSETASDYGITVINHPLNYTENQVDQLAYQQIALDTSIAIVVVFAMSFVPASFVLFLIDERTSRAKQLQFISGVNKSVYWISSFIWDLINYTIPAFVVVIIFLCFQTDSFVGPNNLPCLICLLLLYGWAVTPMMYPFSFLFNVPSTAYVVLTCVNMFIGINTTIATFILQASGISLEQIGMKNTVLGQEDDHLGQVNLILKKVFLIFPQYCLGRGLIDMSINQAQADAYARFGVDMYVNPFSLSLTGWNMISMLIQGFVFFILTLLIQYNFFINPQVRSVDPLLPSNDEEEDDDVIKETDRVASNHGNNDDVIQINSLSKVYKKVAQKKGFLAVDRISVGVPNGECFGLLGVNGAGKTTTFKMLTGDIAPSSGDASIYGRSIVTDIRSAQQNIGYCPQFDAINSLLTAREHLELYAKLRGVPPDEVGVVADWGISQLGLRVYADKPAGTYSGGNKRKLSAAMAFIGAPPVVLLDEPTAGMDPQARRFLWKRITEAVRGRGEGDERCIVLTSHSMEECEALCSRLAIMVNGRLKCIGSSQHLKNKFGKGYTLAIKLKDTNFTALTAFIKSWFIDASVKEQHYNMISYQLPNDNLKLSKVFELLHENRQQLKVEDYSVSQTTLDEVFVQFAKKQKHSDTSLVTTVTGEGNTVFEMTNTTHA